MCYKVICKICIVFFIISAFEAQAQDIVLRGVVSDEQTGVAVDLANVMLQRVSDGKVRGTTTDRNGLFEFNELETGKYIFAVTYVGYDTYSDTLIFEAHDQYMVRNVKLSRTTEHMDEVTVTESQKEDVDPGHISIRSEDFDRALTPAASGDLAGILQAQPGVVATGDRGGQLFIRGGTPSENLILADGSLVYQPFHILGFFSVFSEDVVSKVDLYAGGFGPRYSSRISSVMDIRLRSGNLYERSWSASVSLFVSGLFFESPLKEGKSSLMVSARGSMIEESSRLYLNEPQPLRFNSQLIKYNNVGGRGFNCSGHFIRTYDRGKLDFEDDDFFRWNNVATGGRCAGVSHQSSVSYINLNFGLSHFSNEVGGGGNAGRSSAIYKSFVNLNLTQQIEGWRLDYGFFVHLRNLNYDISELFLSVQEGEQTLLSQGAYLTMNIPLSVRFFVDPGISFVYHTGGYKSSIEPRLRVSWQPRGKVDEEVHAAVGVYRQLLTGISDYRDAGTAFTAWMPIPGPKRQLEAFHALLGWRQPLGQYLRFSVEGYYKSIRNIPVPVWSTVAQFSTDLSLADGTVRGGDLRLNFDYRSIYLGLGYGYSITEYQTEQELFQAWFGEPLQRYHPPHDRRHQLNAHAGLEIGNFTFNISWMYGAGLPFTRPIGFDSYFEYSERPPDVRRDYGDPRVLLEKPYQGRLPDFHRLDISTEQAFELPVARVRVQVGAVNAYDWENLFYYDVFSQRSINQLPLMPYVSFKLESL